MDRIVRITVPDYVYRFYADASTHIFNSTVEDLMADALSAYAGLLSNVAYKERERLFPTEEDD